MSGFALGPAGAMVPIPSPRPGMATPRAQTTTTVQPLDGLPVVYRSPVQARTWTLEYNHRSPFEVADLVSLSRHPGPLYLLDPTTTRANMFTPAAAEPGSRLRRDGSLVGWESVQGVLSANPGGEFHWRAQLVPLSGGAGDAQAHSDWVPARAERWYTLSVHITDGVASRVRIRSRGLLSGTETMVAQLVDVSGWVTLTARLPGNATYVNAAILTDGGGSCNFARAQLTETEHHMPWHPGLGVPTVALTDGYEQTVQAAFPGKAVRSDYTFTLTEVG